MFIIGKKEGRTTSIKCICLLSALSLFLCSCGSSTNVTKSKKTSKGTPNSSSSVSDSNGEDYITTSHTVTEQVIYENGTYITTPGNWQISSGGRRTVQNLSSYTFDEMQYYDSEMAGGSDVRTSDFIRGMGGTFYHSTEKWDRSEQTKALDNANLNELNVNSLRTWGESIKNEYTPPTGIDYIGNISPAGVLDKTVYSDGGTGTYLFAAQDALTKLVDLLRPTLLNTNITSVNKMFLLGNEYRIYHTNAAGAYDYSGFDDITLRKFCQEWCKSRFGTISRLNALCGTDYSSFDAVIPTANRRLIFEFWLFQREVFRSLMSDVVSQSKSINPSVPWGYAGIMGRNDPLGNDLYLDFLDYTSQNLYWTWTQSFPQFSFQIDNLTAWSETAPVVITETGIPNYMTEETYAAAARNYKQTLNIFYMRPRVIGTYIYNYTVSSADLVERSDTWGMVKPDRTRYPAFDAVAQVYTDFKYLDQFYNGASNTPLVALTNQLTDELVSRQSFSSPNIASVLYAKGVPVQIVPSDDASRINTLEESRLILNDVTLYQNPDGSGDVSTALNKYLQRGNKIITFNSAVPKPLYGVGDAFTASSMSGLKRKLGSGFTAESMGTTDSDALWQSLGKFIHGDFAEGKVAVQSGKVDESAVRVLDSYAYNNIGIYDPTYDLQMQMVYKNGSIYLCVVNTGDKVIDNVDITVGVNNGVHFNLHPQLMRGDKNVSVSSPSRANIPSWVDDTVDSKIAYGTISIRNLDTYAYINIGMAAVD